MLFLYSWKLTLIVLLTIPLYLLIAALIRPILKMKIEEKFNRAALSHQFLVESVVGVQTIKAAAIEPVMRAQWEYTRFVVLKSMKRKAPVRAGTSWC